MRRIVAVVWVFVLLACGACGTDPEIAKQDYLTAGNRYMVDKKYSEAIIEYRNAIRLDAKFGEARSKLADAYLAMRDGQNALDESVRAADLLPANTAVQLRAGSLLLLAKQFPEARARALGVLGKEPKNAEALVLLGNALAGLKQIDAAIEQVERAIDESPELTLSYANLGTLQLARGDKEAAEAAFRRAVQAAPNSVFARISLGNFLWADGKSEEAERELKAALALEPGSATTNRALATFYISQNRVAEAETYLKTYVGATPTVEARLVLADYYARGGKLPEATAILTKLASEDQGFAAATLRLAAVDFAANRRPDAHAKVEAVLARQPKNISALDAKAKFLLLENKNTEALTVARAVAKLDPTWVRGQYTLALALEATGANEEAYREFRALFTKVPSSPGVQLKLATHHLAHRNYEEALLLAQQLVKAQRRSVAAHLVYGQSLLKTGDLIGAERELLALAAASPSAEIYSWVGMLYEEKQDIPRARRAYERALQLQPDSPLALAGLVSVDFAEKKPDAALARVNARLSASPSDVNLLTMSGMADMAARDYGKAEVTYRKLLTLEPTNRDAYTRLGAIYISQRRFDDARKIFEEMVRRGINPAMAETMIASILRSQNRPEEARTHLQRALELDPRDAFAANSLAFDYANRGVELGLALSLAQMAKAELPKNGEITDTLGWIYFKKGLHTLAVSTLREASQLNPKNAEIHYHLGLAYLQNGNKPEAKSTLEHVLKLNPKFGAAEDVRRALATIG